MKRKIRDIAAAAFGLVLITFGYARRAKKEISEKGFITGIYFHNPSKQLFEGCVKWLIKNGFTIITAGELGDILSKKTQPPKNTVWLSLDDGWKDNMANVIPFAVENKIPLTFFITTDAVENSGVYWWRVAEANKHLLPEKFRNNIDLLWEVPEKERAAVISQLMSKVKNSPREAMTVDDVKKIAQYDFLTIGSHTVNHVITPNCTDEELWYEFSESKRKLEEWTGKEVNFFCYPNGDLSGREESILKQTGYSFAAAAENEFISQNTNQYRITRFSVGEGYFYEELLHMLGVWQNVMKKIK